MYRVIVSKPNKDESFVQEEELKPVAMKLALEHTLTSNHVLVLEGEREIYRAGRPSYSRLRPLSIVR